MKQESKMDKATIKDLNFDTKNANKHTEKGMRLLEKSLSKLGAGRSILLDKDNNIIAGNGVIEVAGQIGLENIKIIETDGNEIIAVKRKDVSLNSKKGRELALADNQTAKVGIDFDFEVIDNLANEFDLNLKEWEFEPLVFDNKLEASEDDYEVTEAEAIQTNIVLGDLIEFKKDGKTLHRLMCGDSTDSEQVAKLMNGNKADISIQSPPYNVGRTPNGNKQKYKNDSDNKSITDYLALIEQATKNAIINSIFSFINIQPLSGNKLSIIEYLFILKEWFCDYIIWDKMQAEPAMGENILNSRFEFIYVFGENATRRIGVKKFRGTLDNMIFIKSRQDKEYSDIHKATYPIALAAYLIENFSVQSCLDLFCGSGTTMVAAHQLQRKCYGMEIDPIYCQVIIDRMLKLDSNLEVIINGEQYK